MSIVLLIHLFNPTPSTRHFFFLSIMTSWSLSFNVNACYLTFAEIINASIFLGMIVYRFEQWNFVAWNEGGMDRGCGGAFTEISQIGFACRFGKFSLRNLTLEEKKKTQRNQTMKWHLKVKMQLNVPQSPPARVRNIPLFHCVLSHCTTLCQENWWKLQKDNFMRASVCTFPCDGAENEATAPG